MAIKVLKRGKELNEWKAANTPENCPICDRSFRLVASSNRTVDHDHKTGEVRGVLCRNCNGLEGKVYNICIRAGAFISNIAWLHNLIAYWVYVSKNHTGVYYPGTTIVNGKPKAPVIKRKRRKAKK